MKLRKFEKQSMEASGRTSNIIVMIQDVRNGLSYLEMLRKYPGQIDKIDFVFEKA